MKTNVEVKKSAGIARWAFVLFSVFAMSFSLVSCSDDDDDEEASNELVGMWESDTSNGSLVIEFRNNGVVLGTMNSRSFFGDYSVNPEAKTYSYSVAFVDGTTAADTESYAITETGLQAGFCNFSWDTTVSKAASGNNSVVGKWVTEWLYDDDPVYRRFVVFKDDKTFESNLQDQGEPGIDPLERETGVWNVDGNNLYFKYDYSDGYTYNYSINGNTMTFTYYGHSMKLYRIPE